MNPDEPAVQGRRYKNRQHFRSWGKLLLFGEHAVLYGYPALGLSLDYSLSLEAHPAERNSFPELSEQERNMAFAVLARAKELFPNIAIPPAEYRIQGTIPRSSGFGSSAALCVSFAQYIRHLSHTQEIPASTRLLPDRGGVDVDVDVDVDAGVDVDGAMDTDTPSERSNIWEIANTLENLFHGKASGIDTGLACHKGLYAFYPRDEVLPEIIPIRNSSIQLWIITTALPRKKNTRELIEKIQQGRRAEHTPMGGRRGKRQHITSAIERLGAYAGAAIALLSNRDTPDTAGTPDTADIPEELGKLALSAQHELNAVGLGHPQADLLLEEALRLGATGGKLSGAGGGGAFYIVCRNEGSARHIHAELLAYCQKENIPEMLKVKLVHGV